LSYRLLAERTKDFERNTEFDGNANVQYSGSYGAYAADYRRFGGIDSYSLNMAGGIAFIDSSVYFTRPITDSFALVKVGDVRDVKVYNTNQEAGVTGGNGAVLVPNLISYQENYISIDDKDIPVNYSIAEVSKTVTPLNRSGVVVRFDAAKLQGFAGTVFLRKGGVKVPAEYATMEVNVQGRTVESVVGKGGEFYMENLPPGRFPVKIFLDKKECGFNIDVPKSNNTMVDMGEVTCEMD
jgi:outer membrane usher protein